MERSTLHQSFHVLSLSIILLGAGVATARADNIPAYTVTDLGVGSTEVSTDANGNGIVITPDGQRMYTFPNTPNYLTSETVPSFQSVLSALPPLTNAPVDASMTYGNPANAYSHIGYGRYNQNGLFVGVDFVGVSGHIQSAATLVLASQRQADGSFSPFTTLWGAPNNDPSSGRTADVRFLNNLNQVLGRGGVDDYGNPLFYLADVDTQTLTNLRDVAPHWILENALGLDDQGRILMSALDQTFKEHTLLLTPQGVTSDPIAVPEPTTLATLTLGLSGLALCRHRRRKRGNGDDSTAARLP